MNMIAPETAAAFDKLLESSLRSDTPGYVVGVARNNQTIYRRATGLASIELAVANTPSTRMRISSITKQFTGLAVMLLVEDGKLDIDRAVREYLPDLAGPNGTPTLRQLLNHTSGIRDALESAAFFITEGLFPQIPAGLTHQWSSRFSDYNFAPGEGFGYSNYNYMLLSLVIEKASGLSLAEFFKQRVFTPLGMIDTVLFPNDMDLLPGLAASHIRMPDGRYRRSIYPCEELVGGGGIVSTVDDMLRWAANLREHRLGSQASWDEMLRRSRFNNGTEYNYGFGIKCQRHRGVDLLWHDGSTFGFKSALLSYPAQALDIVVMSNRSDSETGAIAIKIAETLLADQLEPAKVNADVAGREALIGNYYSARARRSFSIRTLQKNLLFAINAAPEGLLREEDGALASDSTAGPLVVRHAPSDNITEIELELCGHRETYTRLPETAPKIEEAAAELVGEYRLADFGTAVQVVLDQGRLYIDLRSRFNPCHIQLTPMSADVLLFTATILGGQVQGLVTLERQDGVVSSFFFSLQRTWNLRFTRADVITQSDNRQ